MLAVRRNYRVQDLLSLGSQHCWQVNARIYSGYPTYNKVKMPEMVVEEVTTLPLHGFRRMPMDMEVFGGIGRHSPPPVRTFEDFSTLRKV